VQYRAPEGSGQRQTLAAFGVGLSGVCLLGADVEPWRVVLRGWGSFHIVHPQLSQRASLQKAVGACDSFHPAACLQGLSHTPPPSLSLPPVTHIPSSLPWDAAGKVSTRPL
jgi:hypothetical protein